jgi:hypothetical protein
MKEGHQIGQSKVTIWKTLIGRILLKLKIEFMKIGVENQFF